MLRRWIAKAFNEDVAEKDVETHEGMYMVCEYAQIPFCG